MTVGQGVYFVSIVACVACAAGCCKKSIQEAQSKASEAVAQAKAECNPVKEALEGAQKEVASLKAVLAAAQDENTRLKQTPRFFFDQAVAAMSASDSDEGDRKAIAAFLHVADRFPEDGLAGEAQKKIADLTGRIAGRAKALAKAQAEVRRLIQTCRSNARNAANTSRDGLRFNAFNQMDMNLALDTERRAEPMRKRAAKAKEDAKALLTTVPDPDGKLKEQVERCDEVDG